MQVPKHNRLSIKASLTLMLVESDFKHLNLRLKET